MHRHPRRTLRRLLTQYGPTLLDNPARVDALLADRCGEYRAERYVLVCALRDRASVANWSPEYWLKSCSQRLQSRYCLSAEAAQWATESCSSALRIDPPEPNVSRDRRDSPNGLHTELSDSPRRTLGRLLTDYGLDLLNDPARMNALLADLCGEFNRERLLLVQALKEGIPTDLLSQERGVAASRLHLAQRLQKSYSFSDKAAHWAVESWSTALHYSAPATAQEPPGERKSARENVSKRLSLRQIVWLGLFLIGAMVLAFTWQSVVEYAEWGVAWLLSIPGLVEEKLAQFVEHVARPAIAWLQGIPGLIALGAISGLLAIRALGPMRAWGGIAWLLRILWIALKWVSDRLSLRQKIWLVLGSIGSLVLGYTWQSAIAYAEWGIAWIHGVPGLIGEKLSQFVDHVAIPMMTWLVGTQGLITLGAIIGLLTVKSLGLSKVWRGSTWLIGKTWLGLIQVWRGFTWLIGMTWLGLIQVWKGFTWLIGMTWLGLGQVWRGFTWLTRMTWLGLGRVWRGISWLTRVIRLGLGEVWRGFTWLSGITWLGLGQVWRGISWLTRMIQLGLGEVLGRLSLRLKMWLGLGLIGIVVLSLTWQTTTLYTEWGITWLLGIPIWTEEKLSQFVDYVAKPVATWLVGIPRLIALGTLAGLLAVKSLGLERVWRGIAWLTRVTWLGLGVAFGQLVLRGNMRLGLGLIGILVLALAWQNSMMYTEWGITWLLGIPEWTEEKLSQFVSDFAQPVITWLVGDRDQ